MLDNVSTNNINSGLDPEKPIFSTSIIAEILKVHQRTLIKYDDENLLNPYRSSKNRRLYSFNDIQKGKFIQYLSKELCINLAGIKIIINLLTQQKINPSNYLEYISNVVKKNMKN